MAFRRWPRLLPALLFAVVRAASLQQPNVTLANNPTDVGFYLYVPDELQAAPPILVFPHWCHGDAASAYEDKDFDSLAATHGFIVIYPDSPHAVDKCWDVSSPQTLARDGGGDSTGIVSMVKWTLATYQADPRRVFVAGISSGGMMANVLLGSYPDVFAGGSVYAGVALGCFGIGIPANTSSTVDYWNTACARGLVQKPAAAWAAMARAAAPGYGDGWRPKLQLFHGTADDVVAYANLAEEIKQWTGVLGLRCEPTCTELDTPLAGWTKTVYGDGGWLEAYRAADVGHQIPLQENMTVAFFDLACRAGSRCFRWGTVR